MRTTLPAGLALGLPLLYVVGCASRSLDEPSADGAGNGVAVGDTLKVSVLPDRRTFVDLARRAVVEQPGQGEASIGWDLAFQGRDIFANGGVSGPGNARVFGPLSAPTYRSDTAPEVPLLLEDHAGGAFIDWYEYANHELFSRYHVYGIRDGDRFYKLQVLSYYGEEGGELVPALYRVRYAEVTDAGVLATHELLGIDATAGGYQPDDSQPSGCLELDSELVVQLTPEEASRSSDWCLCFRRDVIAVNGGLSGPRGIEAVDLQAQQRPDETTAEVMARTPASEQELFDSVDFALLQSSSTSFRSDGVVTAFGQRWLEPASEPLAPSSAVWLVVGADGGAKYLLKFPSLSGDPAVAPATLGLDSKSVR